MIDANLSALDKARQRRADMAEQGIKVQILNPIDKAKKHPTSLRMAINAMCWGCVGAGEDANPRVAIWGCSVSKCPLWNVRPYQAKDGSDESE